jgi:hypothetical protein
MNDSGANAVFRFIVKQAATYIKCDGQTVSAGTGEQQTRDLTGL